MNLKAPLLQGRSFPLGLALAAALFGVGAPAAQADTACPQHFVQGKAPMIVNQRMTARTHELCFATFALVHSGLTRTALWSAERISKASVSHARQQVRVNDFHADPRLPAGDRAELSDYQRSGFDRGHLTPSGNAPDQKSQQQTFTLANIVPQNADHNRHLWANIETAVRNMALRRGELYVITGPLFEGATLQQINGRVMVPTSLFKLVYDPQRQSAGAYVSRNSSANKYEVISVADLESRTGINLLPAMPQGRKRVVMDLPAPHERRSRSGGDWLQHLF